MSDTAQKTRRSFHFVAGLAILIGLSLGSAAFAQNNTSKGGGGPIVPVSGEWTNPQGSNHSLGLYRNSFGQFVLMYYDNSGDWLISGTASLSGNIFSSLLYRSTWDFETGTNSLQVVGNFNLIFTTPTAATMQMFIGGAAGFETFTHSFGNGGMTGMYYPPTHSGLGLMLNEQGTATQARFAFYDAAGNPLWAYSSTIAGQIMYFYFLHPTPPHAYLGQVFVSSSAGLPSLTVTTGLENFEIGSVAFFPLAN